jgi:hypothetical protein
MKEKNPGAGLVYQFKVALREVEPPVWRRLQVEGSLTLERLHTVIQKAIGWQNAHLYEFEVQARRYGVPEPEEPEYEVEAAWKITLRQAAPAAGASFRHVYDLGDHSEHEMLTERITIPDKPVRHPVCLAGECRCPPEDCGGPPGYADLLDALRDPDHPDHDDMVRWVGHGFDPEAFDLAAVNRKLRLLK